MREFKITVARIEAVAPDANGEQVRITFQVERGPISFRIPVLLGKKDFDDTEMIEAARNALHQMLLDLAAQSEKWKLTTQELRQLSGVSSRPTL